MCKAIYYLGWAQGEKVNKSKELIEKEREEIEKRNNKITIFYKRTFIYDSTYTNLYICVCVEGILLKNDH